MFVLNYCEKVFKKLLPKSMTYKSEEEHIYYYSLKNHFTLKRPFFFRTRHWRKKEIEKRLLQVDRYKAQILRF